MKEINLTISIEYDIEYIGARQYKKPYVILKSIAGVSVKERDDDTRTLNAIIVAVLEQLHEDSEQVKDDIEFAWEMINEERRRV